MSQQRQATASSRGGQSGGARRSKTPHEDHFVRNLTIAVIGIIVVLVVLGFGAAIIYDRTAGSGGSLTQEDAQATATGGNEARAAMVKQFVNEKYGGQEWYQSFLDVKGDGSLVQIKTNLQDNPLGGARAAKMCDAVSSYIYVDGATKARFTSIVILDVNGHKLVTRPDKNTVCSPAT
jgi:hypothetical protein